MFTGLVTDIGRLVSLKGDMNKQAEILCHYDMASVQMGASIAVDGVCLSVAGKKDDRFLVDISPETLSKTTIGQWNEGQSVNLERALRLGDEMGGHMVSGHVDGIAHVVDIIKNDTSQIIWFKTPDELACFIAKSLSWR